MICSTARNDQGVRDSTANHEFDTLIENQKTCHRKNIRECNRGFCRAYHKCIENTISNDQIKLVLVGVKALYTKQNLDHDNRKPAED